MIDELHRIGDADGAAKARSYKQVLADGGLSFLSLAWLRDGFRQCCGICGPSPQTVVMDVTQKIRLEFQGIFMRVQTVQPDRIPGRV